MASSLVAQLYMPESANSADSICNVLKLSCAWNASPDFTQSRIPSLCQRTWAAGSDTLQCSVTGPPASLNTLLSASGTAENLSGGATDILNFVLRWHLNLIVIFFTVVKILVIAIPANYSLPNIYI